MASMRAWNSSRRREYVRVLLRTAEDGALEAAKFPREGAGLLSSLVDTDGMVELGYLTAADVSTMEFPATVRPLPTDEAPDEPVGLVVQHVLSELRDDRHAA